jgi:hypothetical protein
VKFSGWPFAPSVVFPFEQAEQAERVVGPLILVESFVFLDGNHRIEGATAKLNAFVSRRAGEYASFPATEQRI